MKKSFSMTILYSHFTQILINLDYTLIKLSLIVIFYATESKVGFFLENLAFFGINIYTIQKNVKKNFEKKAKQSRYGHSIIKTKQS